MSKRRVFGVALGLAAALHCASGVAAGILKLSRTEMTLEPHEAPGELWVENTGDTPLYLDVTQQWVEHPGRVPETLVPVSEVENPGLLVSPGRLTLAPGQRYQMTLKVLQVPHETMAWRVTFRPREQIVVEATDAAGMPTPLLVSVGYGAVIYQLADRPSK